ncbi:histidyl-tRNA synthetase [Streptomyces sp. SLBN-118]|uniref:histidine--tRNA ligase n=1 Tax=Streptomyces sp. SLBN-118 TaxID=2768454 RepID=UPI001151CEB3|nr:histidine--tRNA ligase [Streptomyces sp. SLBN-118]TQK45451.1 histidyl-tRNA synthetase [Streptomyces sp. SLBN-118]
MTDQQVVRPAAISGFPEWLPEVRLVEQHWLDVIRAGFERYGFCSVETPSVEPLDVLMAKGETSQEVYTLRRLQEDQDDTSDAKLGLHFDLTVPFARYIAQHFNDLVFPFKRYQIQRVWRGERAQEGRFREFTQCDIDVINVDHVPLHFDAELPRIIHEIMSELRLPAWTINVNNRKVLQGFYQGLGVDDPLEVIRTVDKLDKIGVSGVSELLSRKVGLTDRQVGACVELASLRGTDASVVEDITGLGIRSELLSEGLDELAFVLDSLSDLPTGSLLADLSIARGLDYYTGTVYEGKFTDWPGYGSICSGGRYENLAGSYIRRNLPGIGMSIGLTRIFAKLLAEGLLPTGPASPSDLLMVLPEGREQAAEAAATAGLLRRRGLKVELYHQPDKVGKQVRYASRKGIPYIWFPPLSEGREHEVKDLVSGEQTAADPDTWRRP